MGAGVYRVFLLAAACVLVQPSLAAESLASSPEQVLNFLQKVQSAARSQDYSGVYTYQQGSNMLSSRIVHIVDGTGERERIEMLDGAPREYIRHNETTQCLIPEKKLVVLERGRGDRFPALMLGEGKNIPQHYDVTITESRQRIAGRECTLIELHPKDDQRYGYRLCTDSKTHLLLKVQTLSAEHGIIDQITFTSLQTGDKVESRHLDSSLDTKGWQVYEAVMTPVDLSKSGWRVPFPAGFETVMQVVRPMKQGRQVSHLMLSDGLAAISVFIEPLAAGDDNSQTKGAVRTGAMNIFRTRIGGHWLTALGEVPATTLRDIAERTEYVPLATQQ